MRFLKQCHNVSRGEGRVKSEGRLFSCSSKEADEDAPSLYRRLIRKFGAREKLYFYASSCFWNIFLRIFTTVLAVVCFLSEFKSYLYVEVCPKYSVQPFTFLETMYFS